MNDKISSRDATEQGIDDRYAQWLLDQPEAQITGGDKLVERMEQQWGWEEFLRHFTERAT